MKRSGLALAVALALGGCVSGSQIERDTDYIAEHAERTHDAALMCGAEREIALAEAHLDFLQYESERGKYMPVRRHLEIAMENIEAVMAIVDGRPECFGLPVDTDLDGIFDDTDNCVLVPNPDQSDIDGDRQGDACDDDMDGDGILNVNDNCPTVPNPAQEDTDGDGTGDACSDDRDGDGIPDATDDCPAVPEDFDQFEDTDGCPESDNDQDGLIDPEDDCPVTPEDPDGFEDTDGCPDVDNDGDGILDTDDECPDEPEDFDGDRDEDGCPDTDSLATMRGDRIEISQQINFELNSARITGDISFRILDDVAEILLANPDVDVRIEGHTDSQGSASYNEELSQNRANSVMQYLTEQGIERDRLTAVGFGEEQPIADNESEEGRALNRRVEFHIVNR